MLTGLKKSYWAFREVTGVQLSRIGEKTGIDALTYNAVVMDLFAHIAAQAAPILADSFLRLNPRVRRIADFGCGPGYFVHAFMARGIEAVGYERSSYARRRARRELGLQLNAFDLQRPPNPPPSVDCAMSLEVAEHLPSDLGSALVQLLTDSAPLVLFSAAHPGQGGMGHVNEQPASYWHHAFAARNFVYVSDSSDALRTEMASASRAPWLRQNLMVFARRADR